MSSSRVCIFASLVLSLTGLVVLPARVAAQAATATVLGTVTDQSGAAIPGVTVDVKNTATGTQSTARESAQLANYQAALNRLNAGASSTLGF